MNNEQLLEWAQGMFDNYAGIVEKQIELAKIIALCLQTKALEEFAEEAEGVNGRSGAWSSQTIQLSCWLTKAVTCPLRCSASCRQAQESSAACPARILTRP